MAKAIRDGIAIDYEVAGEGEPTLVLAHAFPLSRAIWRPQVEAFSRRLRVVTYDARGFGRSDAPDEASAYSMAIAIADLGAVLDAVGARLAVIGGLSMGGNVALNFALASPERVAGLLIADTGAGSDDPRSFRTGAQAWAKVAEKEGIEAFARVIMANPIFAEFADRGAAEEAYMRKIIHANSPRAIAHVCREILAKRTPVYELEERLRGLRAPTRIICGAHDEACLAPSRFMAAAIPGATLTIIPGTGHFNNLEAAEVFNAVAEGLLNEARD